MICRCRGLGSLTLIAVAGGCRCKLPLQCLRQSNQGRHSGGVFAWRYWILGSPTYPLTGRDGPNICILYLASCIRLGGGRKHERMFGGYRSVVLNESNDQNQGATGRPVLRLLRDYAWRYRWSYLTGAVFLWITNYLAVSIPGQIGHAIDALRAEQPMGHFVAAIAAMGVAVIVVRSLSRVLIFNPGRHLEYNLRRDLFAHLLRLQPSFYATRKRGDIVSRASNDITWVRTLVGFGGLQIVNVTLAVVLTGWKMVSLSPRLTLMVLLPIVLGSGLVQWGIRRLFFLARRSQEQLGEISEHVLGSLQGMAAIQGFVAEEAFVERFEERNLDWFRTGMRLALIRSIALPLLVLSGGVAMFALIAVGGPMVLGGSLTVGELAAFTALLTVFLPPLRSMGWMMSVIQRGRAALERIFELIDAPIERPEGAAGVVLESGRGPGIELRDLHFAYPDESDREVLTGLTATIPAGGVVGLFGRTGSGKSTLLRLLARLYNPPPETILVDGVDLVTSRPRDLAAADGGGAAATLPLLRCHFRQRRPRGDAR